MEKKIEQTDFSNKSAVIDAVNRAAWHSRRERQVEQANEINERIRRYSLLDNRSNKGLEREAKVQKAEDEFLKAEFDKSMEGKKVSETW